MIAACDEPVGARLEAALEAATTAAEAVLAGRSATVVALAGARLAAAARTGPSPPAHRAGDARVPAAQSDRPPVITSVGDLGGSSGGSLASESDVESGSGSEANAPGGRGAPGAAPRTARRRTATVKTPA